MYARNGSIQLAVYEDGPPDVPAVLLVSPADSPAFRWTERYVSGLAQSGHRVIWFDHRDVGSSSIVTEPYSLDDLTSDALTVLDAMDVPRSHVIGRSMGGMVGQLLAIDHPERVRTLTLVGTTPSFGDELLSDPDGELVEALTWRLFAGPPNERAERVRWLVDGYRAFAGTRFEFESHVQRALALREVDECWRPETGHGLAVADSPSRLPRLAEIGCPTLVVHGTSDPVFGVDHAIALADGIAEATLHLVEDLGHELPDTFAAELLTAWSSFTKR